MLPIVERRVTDSLLLAAPATCSSRVTSWPQQHTRRRASWHMARCKQTQQEAVHLGSSLLPVKDLQAQLDTAVAQEDYQAAAQLRDELSRLQVDNRVGVERANRHFYEAMAAADLSAMQEIWGYGPHVQCIHPVSNCLAGREDVMAGWRLFMDGHGKPRHLHLEDLRIHVYDSSAFITCTEIVEFADSRGRIAATNVFEKQDGQWKIVHHHGADVPRL